MNCSMSESINNITTDLNQLRDVVNKQIDELKKQLNETKDINIFNNIQDNIQDLTDIFSDACMLIKQANEKAENAVAVQNVMSTIDDRKMTQAEYEKELQDKLEVEKAEAKANEPTLVPWHPLSDSKFNWMANEMPAIRKEFGNDAFVKLRLILQKVFGYDVENIFWRDTKIVKHKVQLNEASEYDIETCLQVGFSYLKIDDNGDYKTTKKQLVIKKRWFTIFTVDDLRNFPEFSDETVSEVKV